MFKGKFSFAARSCALVICAAFLMVCLLGATALAKKITLTYATNTSPTGLRGEAEKMFLDEIERHTQGKVKIRPYWGQSLLKGKEILKGVKDGVVDMGHVNINYYPKRLVLNGAVVLVQQGPVKYENKMWVYDTIFKNVPALNQEFAKFKQEIIYTYSVLPVGICFTKPVKSLQDFKGRRVRAASRWALAMLKGTGATPVSIPWGDCYMALQTNAVEGVYTNYDSINRAKLDEVAPTVFVMKEHWLSTPYLITVNSRKWKALPQDVKTGIKKAAASARAKFAKNYASWFDKIVDIEKGMKCDVVFASPADIKTWVNLPQVGEIEQQWIKEAKAAGVADAEAVLQKVKSIVSQGIAKDK
jgi:TRAP-type C4-dicarboxylate transport system substrate-binding protein